MPKCPFCDKELTERDGDSWICGGCGESVPIEYADECKIPCCETVNRCK